MTKLLWCADYRPRGQGVNWFSGEQYRGPATWLPATELKKRFNEVFWIGDLEFVAMALDAQERQVRSIGSNAGTVSRQPERVARSYAAIVKQAALQRDVSLQLVQPGMRYSRTVLPMMSTGSYALSQSSHPGGAMICPGVPGSAHGSGWIGPLFTR